MPATNGGRAGPQWKALEKQVLAEETHCGRCGNPVDHTLPRRSRWGATIGHIIEIDRAPHLIYDRSNVRLEHWICNIRAGGKYGRNKQLRNPRPPKRNQPSRRTPKTSRQW